jgi:hypothetical protein
MSLKEALGSLIKTYKWLLAAHRTLPNHGFGPLAKELEADVERLAEVWHQRVTEKPTTTKRGPSRENKAMREAIIEAVGVPAIDLAFRYRVNESSVKRIRLNHGQHGSDGTPRAGRYIADPE